MTSLWIVLFGLPDPPPTPSPQPHRCWLYFRSHTTALRHLQRTEYEGRTFVLVTEREKDKEEGEKKKANKKERSRRASREPSLQKTVGIRAWKTSVLRKYTYWDWPKIPCFLIFHALLDGRHWWGVCPCWSLAHGALWERASETWPQTFSWSPQNKTGKSWQSVRHRVVTQSVAGNQSLNSSDSSLHHTQCQYTVHKEALSSSLSLSVLLYLSQPLPP